MRNRAAGSILVTLVALTAVACDDPDGAASGAAASDSVTASFPASSPASIPGSTPPDSASAPVTTPPGRADGVLKIGVLLPQTAESGNDIGLAGIFAANLAVAEINEAGGVLGAPVATAIADEGSTVEVAREAINELLAADVDAIVGPASSTTALATMDQLMEAGVLVCSPTANALALTHHPNRELFFRTIPSDSVMAAAMAQQVENSGEQEATVVYLDDEFGRPFARATMERLRALGIELVEEVPFNADDDDLSDEAFDATVRPAGAIVVIADAVNGWEMLTAISARVADDPPFVFVNDAMRDIDAERAEVIAALPTDVRVRIFGLSPVSLLSGTRAEDMPGPYAANSYDCVNLIALGAVEAGTDDPEEIAGEILNVSVAGSQCFTFALCMGILQDDRTINYQGPGGLLDISTLGDPDRGRIEPFQFDERGYDVPAGGALQIGDPETLE